MINFISNWAEQVIVAVIIGTILEMILPKGNTQKYIKTIIRCIHTIYNSFTCYIICDWKRLKNGYF